MAGPSTFVELEQIIDMLLYCLEDAQEIEHVALLEIDFVDDTADEALVAVAREHNRPVAFVRADRLVKTRIWHCPLFHSQSRKVARQAPDV